MSAPLNNFTDLLALESVIAANAMLEKRMENDSSGKILYVGLTPQASAPTDEPVWFICKLAYDGNGFLSYYQLPNAALGFVYSWDDRATYFS